MAVQEEASNGTIKTVVKKSKVTVARANGVKKVFSLPGQKYEPPEEVGACRSPFLFLIGVLLAAGACCTQ